VLCSWLLETRRVFEHSVCTEPATLLCFCLPVLLPNEDIQSRQVAVVSRFGQREHGRRSSRLDRSGGLEATKDCFSEPPLRDNHQC
jgi:hypothetical protein